MALTTIEPTPGLDTSDRHRAHRAGPVAVAVRTSYPSLFDSAGFIGVEHIDLTVEYRATLVAWIDARSRRADEIAATIGEQALRDRFANSDRALRAIDDGLLKRSLYTAFRP
jgi:hypothetical protein